MPEPPCPYADAADRIAALGRELRSSCPKAAVILLTLAGAAKIADFDSRMIDLMGGPAMMIAEKLIEICEQHFEELREIAETN